MQELQSQLLGGNIHAVKNELEYFQMDVFSIQHTLLHDIAAGSLVSEVQKPLSSKLLEHS